MIHFQQLQGNRRKVSCTEPAEIQYLFPKQSKCSRFSKCTGGAGEGAATVGTDEWLVEYFIYFPTHAVFEEVHPRSNTDSDMIVSPMVPVWHPVL